MKIVLVFPPFFLEPMYNLPPLGLIALATRLKKSSHEVVLIDFVLEIRRKTIKMGKDIYGDCAEKILAEAPHVVGFSAQCTTYPAVIQICKVIKDRRPDVKIVIGGHNASFVDQMTLEYFPFVDSIVRGEGEVTFNDLVEAYELGRDEEEIEGVTFRQGKEIIRNEDRDLLANLDRLPLPDYSFLPPLSEYRDACELPRSIAILEVGRGCPYRCVYCSESIMWRQVTRTFSVSRLVREMENLHKNFGAECFLLAYDQFTAKRNFVETFCHQVIQKEMNHLPWYCISRLDSVDSSLLELMSRAGCESMCYGIDSGSKKTLSFIRKKIDKGILYQRIVETADQGIIPTLSFVIGFPEEEEKDIDETLVLALRAGIVGNNNPLIQLPTVLPGTDLHRRYRDRLVREVDTYFAMGLEFDGSIRLKSDEEMIDRHPALFSSFYNLPCKGKSSEQLNLIATYFPLVVRFYPKSFLLLSIDYHESVSGLFLQWLHWLKGKLRLEAISLSPQDCYLHFRHFVSDIMQSKGRPTREHLTDILRYEDLSLEVGKFSSENRTFHIDLAKIGEFKPEKNDKMIVQGFDFDLPMIILDLKAGRFKEDYPHQKTLLLFRQENDILNVSEINPFSKDFLELCDGRSTVKDISEKLFSRYGREMKAGDFFDSCAEAVQFFGDQGMLKSS